MIELIILGIVVLAVLVILSFLALSSIYTVVPADFADVVIQGTNITVYSAHKEYNKDGKSSYFKIPSWFFIMNKGMKVHRIPLTIIPIEVMNFLTFDKDRARFVCDIIAYVSVNDPIVAATRFNGDTKQLEEQVSYVVQSTVRDVTTKKTIREIINDRDGIIETIETPLKNVLSNWGLDLQTVELIDFKDPINDKSAHVIADISSIIETQINSDARQKNAEQSKIARQKEAESEELAKRREIEKDQNIAMRDQEKNKLVAEQQKTAVEKQLDVEMTVQATNAEIQKKKAIIQANQQKEVEAINMAQKELAGKGDRLKSEQVAVGNAASIRENGKAEAEAKELLQAALNKFGDSAIRALVAEKIVQAQKEVGIAGAQALEKAEMKVFVGSGDSKSGFDVGQIIESTKVSSDSTARALLNKMARPNDLGLSTLALGMKINEIEKK